MMTMSTVVVVVTVMIIDDDDDDEGADDDDNGGDGNGGGGGGGGNGGGGGGDGGGGGGGGGCVCVAIVDVVVAVANVVAVVVVMVVVVAAAAVVSVVAVVMMMATGIRTPAHFPYDILAAYGPPVAMYAPPDWRVPSLPTRVVLQKLGEANPALDHASAHGDPQPPGKLEDAKPAQEHRVLAGLPSPLSSATSSDDGPQVLLLARDEHWGRRLVQKVARVVLVLGARDRESLALEPKQLQGQWESALVEVPLVEDGDPLGFEAQKWECAWLGRCLHVPVAEDGAQRAEEERLALATLLSHERDDGEAFMTAVDEALQDQGAQLGRRHVVIQQEPLSEVAPRPAARTSS